MKILNLYTDGGCIDNRGVGGAGVHGYLVSTDAGKKAYSGLSALITPFGYILKDNGKPDTQKLRAELIGQVKKYPEAAEIGTVKSSVAVDWFVDLGTTILPPSSNNIAELKGMSLGMRYATKVIEDEKVDLVLFHYDSKYVVDNLTKNLDGWIKSNWIKSDGQSVKNQEEWIELKSARDKLVESGVKFDFIKVKGHSNNPGNDRADKVATLQILVGEKITAKSSNVVGRSKPVQDMDSLRKEMNYERRFETDNFYSKQLKPNRLLAGKNIYFNMNHPLHTYNGRTYYPMGNHGDRDEMLGKPISDNTFCVAALKERDPVADCLVSYQQALGNTADDIVIGRWDLIKSPAIYNEIYFEETRIFKFYKDTLDVVFGRKMPITHHMEPAYIANRAIDELNHMSDILAAVLDGGKLKDKDILLDVNEHFFETKTEKKKEVRKVSSRFKNNKVVTKIQVGNLKFPLTHGIDHPDRNTLNAFADGSNIYLYMEHVDNKLDDVIEVGRAFIVFITEEQEGLIWAAPYRNTLRVKK